MIKPFLVAFVLGCSALLLASCTAKNEPKENVPPAKDTPVAVETPAPKESPPEKAGPREVTLHVEGMSERLKLL